jgi:hypothetical protein
MNPYGILNSRKRAIIALVHTILFGLLAFYQLLTRQHPVALLAAPRGRLLGSIALTTIYLIVTAVLLLLLGYSRCVLERLYFSLCATSAAIGLLRSALGDPTTYAGSGMRVTLLCLAVITGAAILRTHTASARTFAN